MSSAEEDDDNDGKNSTERIYRQITSTRNVVLEARTVKKMEIKKEKDTRAKKLELAQCD